MLGFYRRGEHTRSLVKVTELVDNVLELYGRKITSLGIAIEKRYQGAGTIFGDAGELRQVFSNLIVNAVDALAQSGDRLCIHVSDSVDWKDLGRRGVRVTVSDNGPGITLQHGRQRLFEAFYTTKGDKGSGIGLWVSSGIVGKHGGSIRFRSSCVGIRTGTCFSVFLPSAPGAVPSSASPPHFYETGL
jgi:signal transduction histidine kinase